MDGELDRLHREEAELRARRDDAGALRILDRMLAIDPTFSPALNNKGALLTRSGRYLEATPVLEAALAVDPANAAAHNNLGWCLHRTGRHEQALAHLEAAWDAGYRDPGVLYNTGRVNLALGRVADGLALVADGLTGSPNQPEAMAFLQSMARVLGVDDDPDLPRFAAAVVAASAAIEDVDVIRANPPLGMFSLRLRVEGVWYGIRFD